MATLKDALRTFIPELHKTLRQCARRAVPVEFGPSFSLSTVKGSLGAFEQLEKKPHVNTLRFTGWDAASEKAGSDNGETGSATSGDEESEADVYVPFSLPLWSSKLGGFGYLPKSHPYPTNLDSGTPLMLLAQINFGELRAQWEVASGKKISNANAFLEESLWPTRGVLSFYFDPFDDLYGCEFAPGEAKKYRVLFFEDVDDVVEPVLKRLWSGEVTAEEAEDALAQSMWTREEQYAEFTKASVTHFDVTTCDTVASGLGLRSRPDDMSVAEYKRIMKLVVDEAWKDTYKERLQSLAVPEVMVPRSRRLWYGSLVCEEYSMQLNVSDMPLDMAPLQSVEFTSLVVKPALEALRDAKRAPTAGSYARASRFTQSAAEEGDEFDDDDGVYEIGYIGSTIGGYPSFTQDDPRDTADPDPDMLLFGCTECSQKLMWGDAGIGNFFISSKDLASRNFGNAWFTWDCC